MRIAQIAPLMEAVPPKFYGGTERIVSYLTEELVAQGHEVTLFASGDSITCAELIPMAPRALRLDKVIRDPLAPQLLMLEKVAQQAHRFDVVHCHLDYLPFSLYRRLGLPFLTTLHGRLDLDELKPLFDEFTDVPVVSISDSQRKPMQQAGWMATVHHGLPANLLTPPRAPSCDYLAFLGRISPEKGPDAAIRIAREAGMKLKIAAKVDRADRVWFEDVVKPMLAEPHVEWIGEIGESEKAAFLGNAAALLFPICWPEPFGLVQIEAMACGCPTIAFNRGSVSEVVRDGVSGFVVEDEIGAVAALAKLPSLDRGAVRRDFDARFTAARMATAYLDLYAQIAAEHGTRGRTASDVESVTRTRTDRPLAVVRSS
ncbi:glycosyltransferase family 4 protein [Roseiterribacter gracilis]|uniref:Glycosyl transferase n=1 Tax=Roseiterribacter gracilis TaxID=2812848 RepID=A0A8S8XGT2_9PROT|nr:glycosyl transferase [Rhodospirillales bacterium TMPK1]